jgi:electron transfer flavoprotein alpha subunit
MITKTEAERTEYANVWVVAEVIDNDIKQVTFELLGEGRKLADKRGGELWCVILANMDDADVAPLFHHFADKVIIVDSLDSNKFIDETYASALESIIEKHKPEIVLCGATARGRTFLPRVAAAIHAGITADCTELDIDENGYLLQTRPAYGGNIIATITSVDHRPQMATVRPRVMTAPEPDTSQTGEVVRESVVGDPIGALKEILSVSSSGAETIQIADADFIVTGGRGVKGPEGFDLLKQLAASLGGAVGASRAAVDAGWIPYDHQVGQTGQTVQPRVYIACGVSGQIQHIVGMRSSDFIIALNKDAEAPIMKLADIAIVGDLFETIPLIIQELGKT